MCDKCDEVVYASRNESPEAFAKRLVEQLFKRAYPVEPTFPRYLYELGWFEPGERAGIAFTRA